MSIKQPKFFLACACFIYALFFFGYSIALWQEEEMLEYQALTTYPRIDLSGGSRDGYLDMTIIFGSISICYFLLIYVTKIGEGTLHRIIASVLIIFASAQTVVFLFVTGPGYLPGQHSDYADGLLRLLFFVQSVFLGMELILLGIQLMEIWNVRRDRNIPKPC